MASRSVIASRFAKSGKRTGSRAIIDMREIKETANAAGAALAAKRGK
jgi:hypothetical protein